MIKFVRILLMLTFSCLMGFVPAGAADADSIRAAMIALQQDAKDAETFQALVQATVASDATPEQARALAVCCLGYHLLGQAANAQQAKAFLQKHHGSAFQDIVSDERLFNKRTCPACNDGIASQPCPDCRSGQCPSCNGQGDKPGLSNSSRLTCTLCRGTGRCKTCNGVGELRWTCRTCRGSGGALEFNRDAVNEAYLSLLREGAAGGETTALAALPVGPSGVQPIILEASQVERINQEYSAATSLNRPAVHRAFLRQVSGDEHGNVTLFLPVPDGMQFVVKDVGSKVRKKTRYYYASLRDESGSRQYRLMLGTDEAFAVDLQKGSTLTSSAWLALLKGSPPWDVSLKGTREVYRSAAEYMAMQ